jgi:methionine-rich copper-binding protein CopC
MRRALALAAAVWLASAGPAWAEADYGGSRPAIDGTVPGLPNPFLLSFTEPLRAVSVQVNGPDTSLVSLDAPHVQGDDRATTGTPLRDAGPGRYSVTWSTVSDVDGSKASGTFAFYVIPESPPPPIPDTPNSALDPRLSTLSQRQAIRDRYRGQMDEALFNDLIARGKSLDEALAAAQAALHTRR